MKYHCLYRTPDGFDDMLMESDGNVLTGLWFENPSGKDVQSSAMELPVFQDAARWLDIYFSGKQPDFMPRFRLNGITPFREEVSQLMRELPFGALTSYGRIAEIIAKRRHTGRMSAQAVGGAVGRNPLCILIPCHRVIGADGSLTGYGGGMKNKIALLLHEHPELDAEILRQTGNVLMAHPSPGLAGKNFPGKHY